MIILFDSKKFLSSFLSFTKYNKSIEQLAEKYGQELIKYILKQLEQEIKDTHYFSK
jgi:hypothetical protein